MILACPDEPLHTSSDSACGEYAEKAFYALPFHWAVLVQSVLDCGTMYNDTISSKMFLELLGSGLWFVCDYSNHSSSLASRYFSWPTTYFLHKDCSCGFPLSYYIAIFLTVEIDTKLFDNILYPSPNSYWQIILVFQSLELFWGSMLLLSNREWRKSTPSN